jgi:hypothetical protein
MRLVCCHVSVSGTILPAFILLALSGQVAVAAEAYLDRLIDPDAVAVPEAEFWRDEESEPEGRRFYSVEYQHYQQDYIDRSSEHGVLLNWQRETLDYGDLSLEATVRNGGEEAITRHETSGQFTFRQRAFALDESHEMDNTAGVLRSQSDVLISSSFRLNLPSSLLGGVQTRIRGQQSVFFLNAGRIGRLDPTQIQGFEDTSGELISLGYSRSLGLNWRAGSHLVHMTQTDGVPEHQSLATALEYTTPDQRQRYQGHLLLDSEGNNGIWLDGDTRISLWRHRYGLFRMEPDLLWTDTSPTDDQQGGYWRAEMARLRFNLTAGLDLTQTNIDDRDDRSGVDLYNAYINGNWRKSSRATLGSSLSVHASEPRNGIRVGQARDYSLSGYIARRFPIGTSRLELTIAQLDRDAESGHGYSIVWDQEWDIASNLSLSSTLSHAAESGFPDASDTSTASMLLRHDLNPGLYWNTDVSYSVVDTEQYGTRHNIFTSLALYWDFLPGWNASLRATHNMLDDVPGITVPDGSVDETTLLLSLRYSHGSGRPFVVLGRQAGSKGYGKIGGQVFYDANGDGVRQAGESVAQGIVVYLDRRYEAVTDNQGRFTFTPVVTGSHDLSLAVEDLPLPWGLLDEAPRPVTVTVRERGEVNFPLQRINQ